MTTNLSDTLRPGLLRAISIKASVMPDACFGVSCDRHGVCGRYAAVDGADPEAPRMARCSSDTSRPGFVRLDSQKA